MRGDLNNMGKLRNIHPGEILKDEFLEPLGITKYKLAQALGVREIAISEIVRGKRDISTLMALKLAKYFGTTAQFWLNLQNSYDIEEEMISKKEELDKICEYAYN
jgi:addiction module HigA family antidote